KHQLGAGSNRRFDFASIETINGDAESFPAEGAHGFGRLVPFVARITSQVDDIGAGSAQSAGGTQNFRKSHPRNVIDLSQNSDVVSAVIGLRSLGAAENL